MRQHLLQHAAWEQFRPSFSCFLPSSTDKLTQNHRPRASLQVYSRYMDPVSPAEVPMLMLA